MEDFVAIDFETANPQRVSACALGYAKVSNAEIVDARGYLIKPIGGHAPFQSKIHGIKEEHTFDKPLFGELFPKVEDLFDYPLVAHSLFDKQVLQALSDHFNLRLVFDYIDTSAIAKERLPNLKNCKLETCVKHFGLPSFKHHDAAEDATACARVFLKLQDHSKEPQKLSVTVNDLSEFKGMLMGVLADDQVNYKEAYSLLYWLEDHPGGKQPYDDLYYSLKVALADNQLDSLEATNVKTIMAHIIRDVK
ncbi:MAG TPA: exonuclease domain-containing protein [Geobacteraceae bacterium]|nr:exonuclease domain-containing protein [Geobacteraceae bacterium]